MFNETFKIADRELGWGRAPYVIAEAGSNFNQSFDTAKRLIDVATEAGADAVKFQLFKASALYPDGGEMYEAFRAVELDAGWVATLKKHCEHHQSQVSHLNLIHCSLITHFQYFYR